MIRRSLLVGKRILSDQLVRSSWWFLVAMVVAGFANYGLQVVLGRSLSTSEYGFFNALLGVSVILGVPVATLQMVISRKTAEYRASQGLPPVASLLQHVSRLLCLAAVVGFLLFACGISPLSRFLRSPSVIPVLLLGLCIFSSIITPVPLAVLQGMQDHSRLAFFQGLAGPARFLLCALPAVVGWGVNGIMAGLLVSQMAMWLWAFLEVKKQVGAPAAGIQNDHLAWSDAIPVLVANFAFTLITQMDLILVNRYFPSEQASVYASAAVLGRAVIYIPGALVVAMFPMVSEKKAQNLNTQPLLFKSLGVTLLFSGVGAALFFIWPREILNILFAHRYEASANILKYYGLTTLPLALLMVLMQYFVARGNSSFGFIMLAGAIVELFLLCLIHGTLLSVVFIFGGVGVLLLTLGVILSCAAQSSVVVHSCDYAPSVGA